MTPVIAIWYYKKLHIQTESMHVFRKFAQKIKTFHERTVSDLCLRRFELDGRQTHDKEREEALLLATKDSRCFLSLSTRSIDGMDARENIAWMNQALNEFVLVLFGLRRWEKRNIGGRMNGPSFQIFFFFSLSHFFVRTAFLIGQMYRAEAACESEFKIYEVLLMLFIAFTLLSLCCCFYFRI